MASIKISDLTSVAALTDNDVLPIVNDGDTKKVSIEQLKEELGGSGGGSDIPIYPFETTNTVSFVLNYPQNFDSTNKSNMQTFLNNLYTRNVGMFAILLTVGTGSVIDNKSTYYQFLMVPYRSTCKLTDEPTNIYLTGTYRPDASTTSAIMVRFDMNITLTWSNHVCTVTNVEYSGYQYAVVLYNDVLTKTNSTSYTPTANYHPATKKYVDDAVRYTTANTYGFNVHAYHIFQQILYKPSNLNTALQSTDFKNELKKIINDARPKFITSTGYGNIIRIFNTYCSDVIIDVWFYNSGSLSMSIHYTSSVGVVEYQYSISLTYSNNVVTNITIGNNPSFTQQYILGVENTLEYTPTNDYHPATKKYVDDKTWIGTQAEYDALETYSENTIYFIKEDTNASE